jgi:hypothetical protein
METYLKTCTTTCRPPTTNGQVVRLDSAANPLWGLPGAAALASRTRDPLPDSFYYGYTSDGMSYKFTGVQTDLADAKRVTAIFYYQNGVSGEERR